MGASVQPVPQGGISDADAWEQYVAAGVPKAQATALVQAKTHALPAADQWEALVKAGAQKDSATALVQRMAGSAAPVAPDKPSAAMRALSGIGHAIMHPIDTAEGMIAAPLSSATTAVLAPSVGEARPDARLSKGGNSSGRAIDLSPYDAAHGGVTSGQRALGAAQTIANLALPALSRVPVAGVLGRAGVAGAAGAGVGALNNPNDPAAGAIAGGLVGAGGSAAASVLPKVAAIPSALGPQARAMRRLTDAIQKSGGSEAVAAKAQAMQAAGRGDVAMLGDLSDHLRAATDFAANNSDDVYVPLAQKVVARQADASDRVLQDVKGLTNVPLDAGAQQSALEASRKAWADPAYDALRAGGAVDADAFDAKVGDLIKQPKIRDAWKEAQEVGLIGTMPDPQAVALKQFNASQRASTADIATAQADWDMKASALTSQGVPDAKVEMALGKRPGGDKANGQFTNAREPNGARRDISKVSDDALFQEMSDTLDKQSDAARRAEYNVVDSGDASDTAFGRKVVATRDGKGGPSMQAKALTNLKDYQRIMDEVDGELRRRGHTDESISDGLYRTQGMDAPTAGDAAPADDSFDFGANVGESPTGKPQAPAPSYQMVQNMKQRLNGASGAAFRRGDTDLGARLSTAHDAMREFQNEHIPGAREVNQQYAARMGLEKALQEGGEKWNEVDTRGLADHVASLKPDQLQQFRTGLASELVSQLRSTDPRFSSLTNKMATPSPAMTDKLRVVFGSDATLNQFMQRAQLEAELGKMRGAVGGSATARRLAAAGFDPAEAATELGLAALTHPAGLTAKALHMVAKSASGALYRRTATALGQPLMTTGTPAITALLRQLQQQRRIPAPAPVVAPALAGGLLGQQPY